MVPPYTTGTPGNYIQHYNTLDLIGLGTIWYNTKQYRVYELYVDYFFNDDPSVPTAAAATNLTKPRPTVVWSVTDTENDAMLYHDTWYYTNAQATAPGFYPGQAGQAARTTVYFNGNVGTPLTQYTVAPNVDLLNNTTYRSYSRITQVPQGRQTTFGTSGLIAVAFVTPITPLITATADSANGRVQLVAQGRDNLLQYNDSNFELNSIGNYVNGANATLGINNTQSFQGTYCLSLTSIAAGDMNAVLYFPTQAKPVTPGQTYSAMAWFKRSGATNRNCRIDIIWLDSTGATPVAPAATGTVVSVPNTFTQSTAQGTAPVGAAYAYVSLNVLATAAAGEVFFIDQVYFAPGTNTTSWAPGGMTSTQAFTTYIPGPNNDTGQTILIERSNDGGTTWSTIRPVPVSTTRTVVPDSAIAVGTQLSQTVYDYEAPLGIAVRYRATTITTLAIGDLANPSTAQPTILSSPVSATTSPVTLGAPPGGQGFWIKNVTSGAVIAVDVIDDTFAIDFPLQDAMYSPLGRPDPVIVTDVAQTVQSAQMTFEFLTDTNWFTFRDSIFKSLQTCLLQKYDGQQWYMQFLGTGNLTETRGPSPLYRTFKCKWVEVVQP